MRAVGDMYKSGGHLYEFESRKDYLAEIIDMTSLEEIKAWFKRRKAWYQEVEERAHAMYKEEQRMKREAKEQHKFDFEFA